MAESTIGQVKTELVRRRGPWRTVEQLEFADFEYLDWLESQRLRGEIEHNHPGRERGAHCTQTQPMIAAGSQ